MRKVKIFAISLVLLMCLSSMCIGLIFGRYIKVENVTNINLDITPRPQYEMSGSDHQIWFEKNTKSEITVSMVPGESIWERIYIPLDAAEVGLYQLSFDVVMETESTEGILEDSEKYVYGCTVGDNDRLYLGDGEFMWKSVTPLEPEHVDLAFWASEEDVEAGKVVWLWNWANIIDYSRSRLFLTNIKVTKIDQPTGAYIDFPNAQFVYNQVVENAEHYYDYTDQTIGIYRYHVAQGTFIRQATYNDFAFSLECLAGHENLNIPLKNLTVGKKYKLKFDFKRSDARFYYENNAGTACGVLESKYILNESIRHTLSVGFTDKMPEVKNREITFTATAETMYWFWQAGGMEDSQWIHYWINNCSLTEI